MDQLIGCFVTLSFVDARPNLFHFGREVESISYGHRNVGLPNRSKHAGWAITGSLAEHWHGSNYGGFKSVLKSHVVVLIFCKKRDRKKHNQFLQVFSYKVIAEIGVHHLAHAAFPIRVQGAMFFMLRHCRRREPALIAEVAPIAIYFLGSHDLSLIRDSVK